MALSGSLLCLQDQLRHAELAVAAELRKRPELRPLPQVGVVVAPEEADEDLAQDAAAHRSQPEGGVVALEGMLRLRQDVVPERRVVPEQRVELHERMVLV